MTKLILGLAILGVIAALPAWLESRRARIDKAFRKSAPGAFAQLSRGVTHYQWFGPTRGPVMVAIHGLTTPSIVWNEIAPAFGELGFRVLAYDLYGRGYSDAPRGLQDANLFVTQLKDLLLDQGIEGDINLLGYSMGGSISVAFAAQNLHRVDGVFLIASAGVKTKESEFSSFCRRWKLIGDWVHDVFGAARMKRALLSDKSESGVAGLKASQLDQLSRQGFVQSVLSARRGMLATDLEAEHRELAKKNIPVFAVWGSDDPVIPISAVGQLSEWNRGAQQDVINDADHGLPYTHGAEVMSAFKTMMRDRKP